MLSKKVVFISIFLVLLLNSASAQYYYDQSFDFGFLSVGGVDDILYLYGIYSGWIDFFLSLLIFLGLTQAVFENTHLRSQSKTLSIGLSLALSFGLIYWERQTGVTLLSLGPLAFLFFLILIYFVIFQLMQKLGTGYWTAGAWAYVVIFSMLSIVQNPLIGWFVDINLFNLLHMLFWIAILIGIIGLFVDRRAPAARPVGGP